MEAEIMDVKTYVKRLLRELEKKNSWGKNQLRTLIIELMLED